MSEMTVADPSAEIIALPPMTKVLAVFVIMQETVGLASVVVSPPGKLRIPESEGSSEQVDPDIRAADCPVKIMALRPFLV